MSTPGQPLSHRVKPTSTTRFHIDYGWWKREGQDLRKYLISHLQPEQRAPFENLDTDDTVDWVDPETAEVRRVDALQQAVLTAAKDPHFISDKMTVVDAIFRVFLANGNKPLSPEELGKMINRSPAVILKTLAGGQVYKGIRPAADS